MNISRRADEKQGKAFIGAMTDEASVELASKIVSESFVFVVGTVLIFAEYERGRRKEVAKQRREEAEREAIMKRAQEEREVGSGVEFGWGLGVAMFSRSQKMRLMWGA